MSAPDTHTRPGTRDDESRERKRRPGLLRIFSEIEGCGPPSIPQRPGDLVIGRDAEADVVLDSPEISRRHAVLRARADGWSIQDPGSHNGTWLSGRRVREETPVPEGALLRLGPVVYRAVADVQAYPQRPKSPPAQASEDAASSPAPTGSVLVGGRALDDIRQFIRRFAAADVPVLVTGETGVGKEVVARRLHADSRRSGPFIAVNCNELVEALVESTLFGHKRGAFTGAVRDETGRFQAANGGTLLLDEVGDLPQTLQGKLLRAIERREINPVGASAPVGVDVRVISATHRDLRAMVEQGTFREDLYHRLRGVAVWLPPLRDRVEDIPLLASAFLGENGSSSPTLTAEVVEALCLFPWPGNVRELQVTVRAASAAARADGTDKLSASEHLPADVCAHRDAARVAPASSHGPSAERTERVLEAMGRHKGNVSHVAEELGLHRAQVYECLKAAGKKAEDFR